MSNLSENIVENDDNNDNNSDEEQTQIPLASDGSRAKVELNAWRKHRSFSYQRNPLMLRRMSQGEIRTCFYEISLLDRHLSR